LQGSFGKLVHLAWLLGIIVAMIVLQYGFSSIDSLQYNTGNYVAIQAGLVLFFMSLIGYFVTRTVSYYKETVTIRKRVLIHKAETNMNSNYQADMENRAALVDKGLGLSSVLNCSPVTIMKLVCFRP